MSTSNSTSSGLQTADAAICAIPAALTALTLISDGTNTCSVIIYDNATTASGTVLAKALLVGAAEGTAHLHFDAPVQASHGLYADVTGTGAGYIVYFQQGG